MADDAEVLRFRSRQGLDLPFEYDKDPGHRVDRCDRDDRDRRDQDDRYDRYDRYDRDDWSGDDGSVGARGLAELMQVVLVGDQVVDVVRRPVSGSGYECAVLELQDRGLLRRAALAPPPAPARYEQQLAWLARIVGGQEALDTLAVEPLELEELCLDGVRASQRNRVRDIDLRLEQWAPGLLGDEGLAASRRLLTRAVALEPALLRSDRDDVATGAVLWAVAKGNDLIGNSRPVRASVIQEVCGLVSAPSTRGSAFAHAVGGAGGMRYGRPVWMYDAHPSVIPLGSPDLLLSRFRRALLSLRDVSLALRAGTPRPG